MKAMMGSKLTDLNFIACPTLSHMSIKEAVFPFTKLGVADVLLGPEMRSTGEVMGIDHNFGWAFAKSQASAGMPIPLQGVALLSVKDADKSAAVGLAKSLENLGFVLQATKGTAAYLAEQGVEVATVNKVKEGRPHIVDFIKNKDIALVVNTVSGSASQDDSAPIRKAAVFGGVPYFTTIQAARAAVLGIEAMKRSPLQVQSLQEFHRLVLAQTKP